MLVVMNMNTIQLTRH